MTMRVAEHREHDPDDGCCDCPLFHSLGDYEGSASCAVAIVREAICPGEKAPDDCPLRRGVVLVSAPSQTPKPWRVTGKARG
jgi:hypothetical protein